MLRIHIRIGELFKVERRFTVHLIRLMAAANDLNTIASSYGRLLAEPKDMATRKRIVGQLAYLFRLANGHLYEAVEVLKQLGKDSPLLLGEVRPELHAKYSKIATTIEPLYRAFSRLRSHVTFHYDFSELEDVLEKWGEDAEGEVLLGQTRTESRHGVADEVLLRVISTAFGLPPLNTEDGRKALDDLLEKVFPLQNDFMDYVIGVLDAARTVYPDLIKTVEEQ